MSQRKYDFKIFKGKYEGRGRGTRKYSDYMAEIAQLKAERDEAIAVLIETRRYLMDGIYNSRNPQFIRLSAVISKLSKGENHKGEV